MLLAIHNPTFSAWNYVQRGLEKRVSPSQQAQKMFAKDKSAFTQAYTLRN